MNSGNVKMERTLRPIKNPRDTREPRMARFDKEFEDVNGTSMSTFDRKFKDGNCEDSAKRIEGS